jgi:hypothetical protein
MTRSPQCDFLTALIAVARMSCRSGAPAQFLRDLPKFRHQLSMPVALAGSAAITLGQQCVTAP